MIPFILSLQGLSNRLCCCSARRSVAASLDIPAVCRQSVMTSLPTSSPKMTANASV